MKYVLGLSLGSSRRDKTVEIELLGQRIVVERRGTDGDTAKFRQLMQENDGRADVLCVGGANLALHWRGRRYPLECVVRLTRGVSQTPVVDGSGVKDSLERYAIGWLQARGLVDWFNAKVLLVSAVDRFGMAEELRAIGARQVICGDLMFNLGIPIPLRFRAVDILAPLCLPLLRRLPMSWLYPTGRAQEQVRPRYKGWYEWADVIVGDFLIIRRYMPEDLSGKLLVTNTTTQEDIDELRRRRVGTVVTTSLRVEGRSFGTNIFEGVLRCLADGRHADMVREDFLSIAHSIGWQPEVLDLAPEC
ncbi:MAG: quinate 5-dehydrogenase [Armatimonadetes bacterium]|nr:quinate 5-dehydrogenase [Armatimonadota bacterium]